MPVTGDLSKVLCEQLTAALTTLSDLMEAHQSEVWESPTGPIPCQEIEQRFFDLKAHTERICGKEAEPAGGQPAPAPDPDPAQR